MSAAEKTPTRVRGKRLKARPTPGQNKPASGRRDGEDENGGSESAKKLKIFHYFGGGGSGSATTPPASATPRRHTKTATRAGRGSTAKGKGGFAVGEGDAAPAAPSWGKLIDPRKQRRWEMLRRLQEGGGGGGGGARVDPTAWARRSYCLSYTPVFQDGRTPGMGSTSATWGWACQSQVFGGVRACLQTPSSPGQTAGASGEMSDDLGSRRPDGGAGDLSSSCTSDHPAVCGKGKRSPRAASSSGRRRDLQSRNFRLMVAWLSSSQTAVAAAAAATPSPQRKTLLEIALERGDGGPAAAFMALMSLAPKVLDEAEDAGGGGTPEAAAAVSATHDPVAFALRLFHAGRTWRRVSGCPAPRRQGPGSRRHPNDPGLAAAVDEADDRSRRERASVEHEAALSLLEAGLAVSLGAAAGGGTGRGCDGILVDTDPLVALALEEALTAAEARSLAKALGVSVDADRGTGAGAGAGWRGEGKGPGRRWSGGGSGGSAVEGKDEVCRAVEQWMTRPGDAAKRRSRAARAAREAAQLVSAGTRKDSGSGGGSEVLVLRLADDAREAIHRIHVAFFAAARHAPHDAPAVLGEDLDRVVFGGGGSGGSGGVEEDEVAKGRPTPPVVSSLEVFANFYRLVCLGDDMEIAAGAGDDGLAYGSLHEASTALLPSGCPLCRRHLLLPRAEPESVGRGDATVARPPLPPHCDICELSARVVMRGVGLMERDKDYNNAFHYLEILLQAGSQRLSVQRPRYWLRLVTDLCHRKCTTEALQACEKALAEARPPPTGGRATLAPPETSCCWGESRNGSSSVTSRPATPSQAAVAPAAPAASAVAVAGAEEAAAAAAILPLGEALPLLRRAVRLAVPPLRWRRRPPPELREAALRVMTLDLSWRRSGGGGGGGGGSAMASPSSSRGGAITTRDREEEEQEEDEDEVAVEAGGEGEGAGGTDGVAPGTSLEQAVLDTMLAELGPDWKGLHSENSICLGLFALLCWDALFAREVSASLTSAEPTLTAGKHARDQKPLPRDIRDPPSEAAGSGCCGVETDVRSAAAAVVAGEEDAENGGGSPGPASSAGAARAAGTEHSSCRNGRRRRRRDDDDGAQEDEEVFRPFPSPFQSEPVDLLTPAFAGRRRRLLGGVYAAVERGGAGALIRRNWSRHYGKACTGLNWNLFPDGVEGWVTVACAIGPLPLSRVCRNLASNYWAWRHGLPDLFLWRENAAAAATTTTPTEPLESSPAQDTAGGVAAPAKSAETAIVTEAGAALSGGGGGLSCGAPEGGAKKEELCKWVEVKGPGDSLSCAQEAWIDSLVGAGADFVLLRVEDSAGLPR